MLPQLWSRSQLLLEFDLCYRNFICHRCSRKKKKSRILSYVSIVYFESEICRISLTGKETGLEIKE